MVAKATANPSSPLTGLPGGSKAYFLARWRLEKGLPLLVVSKDEIEMEGLADDLEAALALTGGMGGAPILLFPSAQEATRLATLGTLAKDASEPIVLTTVGALAEPTVSMPAFQKQVVELRPGSSYPRSKLLEALDRAGYRRTPMVETEGETAVRGEVVDIWPPGTERPWRLLFNEDTLESLREFEAGTQRSTRYLEPQKLIPVRGADKNGSLWQYLPKGTAVFWDDVDSPHPPPSTPYGACPCQRKAVHGRALSPSGGEDKGEGAQLFYTSLPHKDAVDLGCLSTSGFSGQLRLVAEEAHAKKEAGWRVFFLCHNAGESDRLAELLEEHLGAKGVEGLQFPLGPLRAGFQYPSEKLLVFTNGEIFGRYLRRPRWPKFQSGQALDSIRDIRPGDYVVHQRYGVGRYRGLERLTVAGQEAEFLKLEYRGADRLYVPLPEFREVQKYTGAEGKRPRLNALDTARWERVKARVKAGVQELAKELLKVHATRAARSGHAFSSDSHLEEEFAASFLYEETPDQTQAIADVKRAMQSPHPMDRLIIGDVGFGKTEVAMRAAFKAVLDSKQAAILVPTTLLAEQHYRTFRERFADYPVKIGVLTRFQSPSETRQTLANLAQGLLDIVIGTHRLLQKDIRFKDLGLLIIDEEHRFGVKHKEQLKKLREALDVLTLTATPIPRTLSFALSGLRDLSVIETPPTGRLPITTHVGPLEEKIIQQAIQEELARDGQVFYVHNRIETLDSRLRFLNKLCPGIPIGVVHGQMSADAAEKTMWEFLQGRTRLLLSTTIIESGLDIPRVNTLIVEEAESFGLAQLYQLRGRVGRERRRAYCYLFFSPGTGLTEDARLRLEALREFTELGSGYRLALRDMEIRGTGNLLGAEQHGFIAAVGLDLYTQLLNDEIARLKGQPIPERVEGPSIDLAVPAYFPADYMPSEEMRILFYKKLLSVEKEADLENVASELQDRFGPLPGEARALLDIARLKITARQLAVALISQKPSALEIQFMENTPVNPSRLVHLAETHKGIRFRPGPPFTLQVLTEMLTPQDPIAFLRGFLTPLG